MVNMKHLVIVRTSGSILDLATYNCQELGLAQTLSQKGWLVSLVLAGQSNKSEKIGDVTVYYRRFWSLNQQLAVFDHVGCLLKQIKPDLIQIHEIGLFMSWIVSRWAKRHNVPCFLIQGNYQTTQKPILKQFEHLFNCVFGRSILRHVKGVGYKTKRANEFVQKYRTVDSKPTYIGLDASKFAVTLNRDWLSELGIVGKRVLLYVGSLEQRRNPIFLFQVLKNLPEEYVLIMVGQGPQYDEVSTLVKDYNMERRCFLLGKLSQRELPALYGIADLFLLASDYEIYGMVILESMYFGVPVVSSRTAGSESIIDDNENGMLLDSFDVDLWSSKIQNVMSLSECLKKMKNAAKKKILEELLWESAAEKFIELYEDK